MFPPCFLDEVSDHHYFPICFTSSNQLQNQHFPPLFLQFPLVKSHFCARFNHRGEAHEEVAIALIVRCGGHATQTPQDPILEAMDVVPHQTMA